MWPRPERGAAPTRGGLCPAAFAVTLGALLVLQLPVLPDWRWLLLLALPAALPWRGRRLWIAALLGVLLTFWRAQSVLAERWLAERTGEELSLRGTIASLPEREVGVPGLFDEVDGDAASTTTWRFVFAPRWDVPANAQPSRIRASWYRTGETLKAGECWTLRLRLRSPHGSRNPGSFDYEAWLFRQGVGATATVLGGTPCAPSSGGWLLRTRQALVDRIAGWLPGHPALPLVQALALGDTAGITDTDWQAFRLTGTTHLVAISGFNIALVAGLAFFALRWGWSLWPRLCLRLPAQRAALAGAAALALVYAALAGFEAPVQRAAWMLAILVCAGALGGRASPARALMLAWITVVALDPLVLLTPGLWLSFSAVAAIFYATGGRVPGTMTSRWMRWRAAVLAGMRVQLMLSLALAPLSLYFFQGSSLSGPLVNLIAVPVVALLTPALFVMLLVTAVLPAAGLPLLTGLADVLAWLHAELAALAARTPQAWLAASPPPAALLLAGIGAVLLFAPRGLPLRLLAMLCFLPLLIVRVPGPTQGFRVTVLDVGQGLAVVVRTQTHALLFDAGPAFPGGFDAGRAIVAPYLLHEGVRRLDRLTVSHADLDHRGGVPAVRALIEIDEETGALSAGRPCIDGETWTWDGVRFRILNGPAPGRSDNDGGCVLKIEANGFSALLPADIEAGAEARLVAEHGADLRTDLLVTPHHGSRTSSSQAFVAAVAPKLVVHSAGWHHRFRHPRPEVVARYAAAGARQFDTADSGAVTIAPLGDVLEVTEERQASRRLWANDAK